MFDVVQSSKQCGIRYINQMQYFPIKSFAFLAYNMKQILGVLDKFMYTSLSCNSFILYIVSGPFEII